ncbi:hypothetical protein ACFPRL_09810 [Pseudoclavibacter helvolus]
MNVATFVGQRDSAWAHSRIDRPFGLLCCFGTHDRCGLGLWFDPPTALSVAHCTLGT